MPESRQADPSTAPGGDTLDALATDPRREPPADLGEQTRMANLRARMFGVSAEPTRVARFVLLEVLGAGGMGVVYAAYDPRLDRRVALKLVHNDGAAGGSAAPARLLREAQAMARLSHPGVVQIHEVGVWQGRVFIAMELVAGRTLAAWLAAAERPWQAIVGVFCEAGRGLAAAHAAGIVHRDFKPENVLVGDDGRVRVTDFGLARGARDVEVDETWREPEDPLSVVAAGSRTATGALAGTPAYMSPEQFLGEAATVLSDQFSFCVALHQALHGAPPFPGEDRHALAHAVIAGQRREPLRLGCPRRLHRALVRGLARAPGDRFPGMDALLAAVALRKPWRVAAPVLAVSVAAAAGALLAASPRVEDPCSDANVLLAGTWDEPTRTALERVFHASGVADAELLWSSTAASLDRYGQAVATAYQRSCVARQRGESSSELHDLRVACLRRRLGVVGGVLGRLRDGAPELLRQAPRAVVELDDLGTCQDDRATLQGTDPAPPGRAVELAEIRGGLDAARARELLGDFDESGRFADQALAQARGLGHAPTLAEALYQRGRLAVLARDAAVGEATLREAQVLAVASRHDALVPELWSWRVHQSAAGAEDLDHARELLRQADAWHTRSEATPSRQAELELARSLVDEAAGDYTAAAVASRRVVDILVGLHGAAHLKVAIARYTYGNHLSLSGRPAEALVELRAALEIATAIVGGVHTQVADIRYNLGAALLDVASPAALDEAEGHLEAARRIHVELSGPVPLLGLAMDHIALAQVANLRDDLDEAERRAAAAMTVYEHYPEHPDRALGLSFRAALAVARERPDEAIALHEQARGLFARSRGEASEYVAITDLNLGDAFLGKGDAAAARARYEAAIQFFTRMQGADAVHLGNGLRGLARAQLAEGLACAAQATLMREAAWREPRGEAAPPELAELSAESAERCVGGEPR